MKRAILFFILLTSTFQVFSQAPKEIFLSNEATWFGLDFTQAKFLGSFAAFGDAGQKNGQQIKDQYFKGWNDLVVKENEKYNLKEAYKKTATPYDLTLVAERNTTVDADNLFSEKSEDKNRLSKDIIAKIIKEYNSNKKGLGLVFIVDNFDKPSEEGQIWVTFFDIESRNVLYTEKFTGKPGGFGIKNYWAGAILDIIKKSGKEYKKLEKLSK